MLFSNKSSNRAFSLLWVIVILIAIGLIGAGIYQYLSREEAKLVDWSVYQNEEYAYKIKYPKDWDVVEYFADNPQSEQEIIEGTPQEILKSPGGSVELDYVVIQSYPYSTKCGPTPLEECSGGEVPSGGILEVAVLYTLNSFQDYLEARDKLFGDFGYSKVSLGKAEAYRINEAGVEGFELFEEYIIEHDGRIFELHPYIYIKPGTSEEEAAKIIDNFSKLLSQALSTFQFLE